MKDVTKKFFKQPNDPRKKANLNYTRADIYAAKLVNIYRVLGQDEMLVKIRFGNTITRQFPATKKEAVKELREYAKIYFLDITYANTKDFLTITLTGLVPGGLKKVRAEKSA